MRLRYDPAVHPARSRRALEARQSLLDCIHSIGRPILTATHPLPLPLLQAAVDRLVSKPNRAVQLVPWIRAVLHHHTAYLMSAPGVQPALTSLFQAIDSRVRLHDPLLRLYGRLGLVLHHTRTDKAAAGPERPGPEVRPRQVQVSDMGWG